MSKRIEGPIELEHGTFNPGDECIAVTICTGHVNVARVEYVGYVVQNRYNYQTRKYEEVKKAQIRRPTKRGEWYNKETGEKTSSWRAGGASIGFRYVDGTVVSTLCYNRLLPAATTGDQLIKEI